MVSARRLFLLQVLITLLCTGLMISAISLCYHFNFLKRLDNFQYDLHIKWRGPGETSGNIVLILMDEKSAVELKRQKGTWSRRQLAEALNNLCEAGTEIIGLDMILSAPDLDTQADLALAKAIEDCGNVILARVASAHGREIPPYILFEESSIGDGFIDFTLDEDGILRGIPYFNLKLLADGGYDVLPAFSLELARFFLNIEFDFDFPPEKGYIVLGAEGGKQLLLPKPQLLINYHGNYTAFPSLSYADVVKNRFPKKSVKGKIVIIGSSLSTQKDFFSTPFSRFTKIADSYKNTFGTVVKGVLKEKDLGVACHAHAVETILSQAFIRKIPEKYIIALTILIGIIGLLFYIPRIGMLLEVLLLGGGLAAIFGTAYLVFLHKLLRADIAPLISVFLFQFVAGVVVQKNFSKRKTALVTNLFGKYVSPSVVDELIKGDIDATLAGRRQDLTMLFSDLRSFTTLSEQLGAKNTSLLLNTYFNAMIPIVFEHQGTLDKLMGDAIMAFFGAPNLLHDHPVKAAETALNMLEAITKLRLADGVNGAAKLHAGIGLNTGFVTVGNLGSQKFMDYTIIGDAVNLASRLEGLNKTYGTHIIVSEFTASRLDDRFLLRQLDMVRVKGKEEVVTIFELIGIKEKMDAHSIEVVKYFESGLDAYRKRGWDLAERYFKQALLQNPADNPSQLYLKRIEQLKKKPPEEDWDGETVFDHK